MLVLLLAAGITISGCKKEEEPVLEPVDACAASNENGEWGYDHFGGPACWGSVCSHASCTGTNQSPIDIVGATDNTINLPSLQLNPGNTPTNIVNNGHTIQFNMNPGTFMTYGTLTGGFTNDLTLGQFHFHASSEHKVAGTQAVMEAHFVHRSIWEDKYTVLSVLFEEGAENAFLKQFEAHLPTTEGASFVTDTIQYNPYDLLPANKSYYKYSGSLTTPPCTEVVTWIVFENKVEASAAQIALFSGILDNNFRPTQDLNGRTIEQYIE